MKKTNFDRYLEEQLKDPVFAERYERAGEAWDVALQLTALREQAGLSQSQLARLLRTTQQRSAVSNHLPTKATPLACSAVSLLRFMPVCALSSSPWQRQKKAQSCGKNPAATGGAKKRSNSSLFLLPS